MKKILISAIVLVLISSCTLLNQTGKFIDPRDGNKYSTIKIDDQEWLSENLKFKADSDCWCYNNDQKNCEVYGRLYNLETAKTVCPAGWRLPSINDWQILLSNIGMDEIYMDTIGKYNNRAFDSLNIGGKLKSELLWDEQSRNNNESGFSALPSGHRTGNAEFFGKDFETSFWTNEIAVLHLEKGFNTSYIWASAKYKRPVTHDEEANPVRCIKNNEEEKTDLEVINPKGKAIAIIDEFGEANIYGQVQFNYNPYTNSLEPLILMPGNLFLFRGDIDIFNNFHSNAGAVYRVDNEKNLFEIGRFDCNETNEMLKEAFLLKSKN